MSGLFDARNDLWRTVAAVADVCGLSLLWAVLCLPVVTIGPATAALYFAVTRYTRRMEPGAFAAFFRSFRENLKQGIQTTLLLLPGAALLAVGLVVCWFLGLTGAAGKVMLAVYTVAAFLCLGAALYLFPLLGRFTFRLGDLFRTAGQLALGHLPVTIALAATALASLWLTWVFVVPLTFLPGVTAVLHSLLLERVFRRYSHQLQEEFAADRSGND